MDPVYVFATLGESPAVLTELLWWLGVRERRPFAGIEVWATRRGAERLVALQGTAGWRALEDALGPSLPPIRRSDVPGAPHAGFHLFTLRSAGRELDDVRSDVEAAAVGAALHDRLRALRETLPSSTAVVGSLAGGRKTVSAALQTAFSLQARRKDRLVHIVPDARLERALGARMKEYLFPSEAWAEETGIDVAEQVSLYDVPFPRLRLLVPGDLARALEQDWEEVWPAIDRFAGESVHVVLERVTEGWRLDVFDWDGVMQAPSVHLGCRAGAVLAAIALLQEPGAQQIADWLDAHPQAGWRPRWDRYAEDSAAELESRNNDVSKAVGYLRRQLNEALPRGLRDYRIPRGRYVVGPVDVRWAAETS